MNILYWLRTVLWNMKFFFQKLLFKIRRTWLSLWNKPIMDLLSFSWVIDCFVVIFLKQVVFDIIDFGSYILRKLRSVLILSTTHLKQLPLSSTDDLIRSFLVLIWYDSINHPIHLSFGSDIKISFNFRRSSITLTNIKFSLIPFGLRTSIFILINIIIIQLE